MKLTNNKIKVLSVVIFIAAAISFAVYQIENKVTINDTATIEDSDLIQVVLDADKKLFFKIEDITGDCGSGGCSYHTYVGKNVDKTEKEMSGFDSFSVDCESGKVSRNTGESSSVFGYIKVNQEKMTVSIYEHLNAQMGSENIYHISKEGTPTLIASYDNTCDAKINRQLFVDKTYPVEMSKSGALK